MSDSAFRAARSYVFEQCIAEPDLAAAVGLEASELARLGEAGVVPEPTYRVGRNSVTSRIGTLGVPEPDAAGWYGPAVVPWLRRAALIGRSIPRDHLVERLTDDLAQDLARELDRLGAEAAMLGWRELFVERRCDLDAARRYVAAEWSGWMTGAWAVCLRRFDGRSLVVKEMERQRIAALMASGVLTPEARQALLDAMLRLDAVLLPFAPHERATGTPGRFIDEPARRFGLPWPVARAAKGAPDARESLGRSG